MTRSPDPAWDDAHGEPFHADDARIRAGLMTLRDDVDRVPLPDPAFIRSRYAERTRRRALGWVVAAAAVIIAAAGIAFSQLGNPWAADSPELLPGETATSTPSLGTTIPPCNAVVGEVNTDVAGITAEQAATARQLMDLALACDQDALVGRAVTDETTLSFGDPQPEEVFVIPPTDDDRYRVLTRLLTVSPELDPELGIVRWPAEPESDADWQALVAAGILSRSDMELIQDSPEGYLGWRLGISPDGTWSFFVGGD